MISIVIPFFNEEDNIEIYDERLFSVIGDISDKYCENFEYIFVDDGSSDNTLLKLNEIAGNRHNVTVLPHVKNKGVGAAVKTGINAAKGKFIICLDSDLTYRPEDISILLDSMKNCADCDCISGSPYLNGELDENISVLKLIPSKTVNFLYKFLLGTDLTCFSGIFRLYKREVFDRITLESHNYDIFAEIISKMLLDNMKIVEVPVKLHTRQYGVSKLDVKKETINNLKLLYKIFSINFFNRKWT